MSDKPEPAAEAVRRRMKENRERLEQEAREMEEEAWFWDEADWNSRDPIGIPYWLKKETP